MTRYPNFTLEKKLWRRGYIVVGVDEVGRGALAGPLIVGAYIFGPQIQSLKFKIQNLGIKVDDSKKLKPREREVSAKWLRKNCLGFSFGSMSVATINKIGIAKATASAMRKAIYDLRFKTKSNGQMFVLADAFYIKYLKGVGLKNQKAIIKGDQKVASIAAASILAKVHRDRLMKRLSRKYPQYLWGKNKGYGTKKHQGAIKKYGITKLHRKMFVRNLNNN